jgi:hypothetical protein
MDGQAKAVEQLRSEARLAALEAAAIARQGDRVLRRAHEVAQVVAEKVSRVLPALDKNPRPH